MEISVNDLVERVKINMEELTDVSNASVKLEVGIDVEQYIRAKLPDALLSVWASTPTAPRRCNPSVSPTAVAGWCCPRMCGT